jgi:hypothetical protein
VRWFFRIPILRDFPARLIAFGIWRVRIQNQNAMVPPG